MLLHCDKTEKILREWFHIISSGWNTCNVNINEVNDPRGSPLPPPPPPMMTWKRTDHKKTKTHYSHDCKGNKHAAGERKIGRLGLLEEDPKHMEWGTDNQGRETGPRPTDGTAQRAWGRHTAWMLMCLREQTNRGLERCSGFQKVNNTDSTVCSRFNGWTLWQISLLQNLNW